MRHSHGLALALTCLMTLPACADTYELIRPEGSASVSLDPAEGVYVSMPDDGVYGDDVYAGSGAVTSKLIAAALSRHSRFVRRAEVHHALEHDLVTAGELGCRYLVHPSILHWEDRATEWSGISDKIEVMIEVLSVDSGRSMTSTTIQGTSGLFTFGGDHPQDLLPEPIEAVVHSLYP